ncbi:Ppx/GppA family phosphatase [candidate division KSB1 bacterium]|nr:Ppx/GppA family phosphatase [candidate division KSB1 bacterium]NIR69307.1 Ppx/GppA family phosphatase [candidate division KSB1 bacterium]NIS22713.1 Ppx/GppA family phosphatase [candidate division KSB1 bacterium]NIT69559.1 Ppx/GppA family phosphatase [candidate division KSB1 bacterium]NIU23213.1 Ppx/GppA family phosphatase [candidate division KSB1 bacterium]
MKNLAAIDIGTNTALLLVAEAGGRGELHPLFQQEEIVKLGDGVDKNKRLTPEAVERALTALRKYKAIIHEFGAEQVVISGTSAVRDAQNRSELIRQIKDLMGVELQVLSGEEEARLTYLGALSNKSHLPGSILLIDVGGGSTECILGTNDSMEFVKSLDVGSVRLTERFVKHDPVTDEELNHMRALLADHIEGIDNEIHRRSDHFVGVAGTVTTLAAMNLELQPYQPELVDNSKLTLPQVSAIIAELQKKTIEERKRIPGLRPARADVILAGAVILEEFMKEFNFEECLVSDRGLRYGLLLKLLKDRRVLS